MRGHLNHQQEMLYRMLTSGIEAEKIVAEEENYVAKTKVLPPISEKNNIYSSDILLKKTPENLRNIEWNWLSKKNHSELYSVKHHKRFVKCITTPDGRDLLTLDEGNSIRRWRIEKEGIKFDKKIKHRKIINCLDINSTGKRAAFCDRKGSLRILDLKTWQVKSESNVGEIRRCKFYPGSDRYIAMSNDLATITLWDYSRSFSVKKYKHGGFLVGSPQWRSIYCMDFSPDGKWLAFGGGDRKLKLWDIKKSTTLESKGEHKKTILCCAFDSKSEKIISGDRNGVLVLWEYSKNSLQKVRTFVDPGLLSKAHSNLINACHFTPDGKEIVTASDDNTLKLWSVSSGKLLAVFQGHYSGVKDFSFDASGQKIFSVSSDKSIKIWNTKQRNPISIKAQGNHCKFSPDGTKIVTFGSQSYARIIKLWDTKSKKQIKMFIGHRGGVTACCFHPDGKKIISASGDMTIKIWDIETGKNIKTLKGHKRQVNHCALNKTGSRLISTSNDRTVKLWDLESGGLLKTFPKAKRISSFCHFFSNDTSYITASRFPGLLTIRNLENGALLKKIVSHQEHIKHFTISSDKKNILTCGNDNVLRLWDFENRKPLQIYRGHKDFINKCILTKDGKRAISASKDGTIKIWDLKTGTLVLNLKEHQKEVTDCDLSPQEDKIISIDIDGILKIWDIDLP